MSIARRTEKNPKVRKDLNIRRAVSVPLIKVLADLEKLRAAFFYRHLGPHGPKEAPPLHPEPLSKRAATAKPMARLADSAQPPKRQSLFRYGSPACL